MTPLKLLLNTIVLAILYIFLFLILIPLINHYLYNFSGKFIYVLMVIIALFIGYRLRTLLKKLD